MNKNNKANSDIYRAFDSVVSPDAMTKQKIFNNVLNKKKTSVFRFRNVAIPAAAVVMMGINAGIIYDSVGSVPEYKPEPPKTINNYVEAKTSETIYTDENSTSTGISLPIISPPVSITSVVYSTSVPYSDITTLVTTLKTTSLTIENTTSVSVTETSPETEHLSESQTEVVETVKNKGELLPPVSEELKALYEEAYDIYKDLSMGMSKFTDYDENGDYICEEKDIVIDGIVYTRANPEYFKTLDDINSYFHMYFTDDFIQKINVLSKFIEYEGNIYFMSHTKGGFVGYAGHTYEIISQSDNEINIKATCYIGNSDSTSGMFFETPENISDYKVIERDISFKKENGIWLVDNTELMW